MAQYVSAKPILAGMLVQLTEIGFMLRRSLLQVAEYSNFTGLGECQGLLRGGCDGHVCRLSVVTAWPCEWWYGPPFSVLAQHPDFAAILVDSHLDQSVSVLSLWLAVNPSALRLVPAAQAILEPN